MRAFIFAAIVAAASAEEENRYYGMGYGDQYGPYGHPAYPGDRGQYGHPYLDEGHHVYSDVYHTPGVATAHHETLYHADPPRHIAPERTPYEHAVGMPVHGDFDGEGRVAGDHDVVGHHVTVLPHDPIVPHVGVPAYANEAKDEETENKTDDENYYRYTDGHHFDNETKEDENAYYYRTHHAYAPYYYGDKQGNEAPKEEENAYYGHPYGAHAPYHAAPHPADRYYYSDKDNETTKEDENAYYYRTHHAYAPYYYGDKQDNEAPKEEENPIYATHHAVYPTIAHAMPVAAHAYRPYATYAEPVHHDYSSYEQFLN